MWFGTSDGGWSLSHNWNTNCRFFFSFHFYICFSSSAFWEEKRSSSWDRQLRTGGGASVRAAVGTSQRTTWGSSWRTGTLRIPGRMRSTSAAMEPWYCLLPAQPGRAACRSLVLGSNFKNNFWASAQLFRVGPADVFFSSDAQLCHPSAEAALKISVIRSTFQ